MTKTILVISGATATGKSDLAIALAQKMNGEIINADIGSWYEPLTIGTAKPDWRNQDVPHHMFDILSTPQDFTVVQFRARVIELAQEIWSRNKTVIVVGGSAFYIKALWYRQADIECPQTFEEEIEHSNTTSQDLWRMLSDVDPLRASKIHKNDRYRLVRALAIYRATGQKPSCFEPVFDPIADMTAIFCMRDRSVLYDRIDQRVLEMLQSGWIHEVQNLVGTSWEDFLYHKKIIGYDDILQYLHGDQSQASYQAMIAIIQQKTRNYAKRQITFLKKLHQDIDHDRATSMQQHAVMSIDLGRANPIDDLDRFIANNSL